MTAKLPEFNSQFSLGDFTDYLSDAASLMQVKSPVVIGTEAVMR